MGKASHVPSRVVIIGGGPAGLTAAYQLSKKSVDSLVLEKDYILGGISRTENYKGYHFDIGGHRFFTKVDVVKDMWHEVLPEGDFLKRRRLSRIFYNKKFFYYPLRPFNALFGLGLWSSFLILCSYIYAHWFPRLPEDNFERWVSNRFGKRLYNIFFKTYTEKVWGIPGDQIAAEWAAQRIKGLSLLVALKNALTTQPTHGKSVVTTLIDSFYYPKRGPGMMWDAVAERVTSMGGEITLGAEVEKIRWTSEKVKAVDVHINGKAETHEGDHFISTMPIRELIAKLDPPPPSEIQTAAESLQYRDFLTVALILTRKDLFPDNWIYIHDPEVLVGRIQNFKNWSPDMVPDNNHTCLGLEYFCFEGDGLWSKSDQELIELGKKEIEILGFAKRHEIVDGHVVRMPKAYPVYDNQYQKALTTIRQFLIQVPNLQLVGRNGMHRYNNQDHSMLTAMLAVENIFGTQHDLWSVNVEQEYHEEMTDRDAQYSEKLAALASTQPLVPSQIEALSTAEASILRTFSRMDKLGFATAIGSVSGIAIFVMTMWLVIKGGNLVGPHLQLLNQFFLGYTVTIKGAFIGMAYSFFWGFLWGWVFAYLRNFFMGLIVYRLKKQLEMISFNDFLDHY